MERLVELRAAVGRLFYSDDRCFEDYDFLIKNIESLLKENASLQARLDKAVELVDLAISDLDGVYGDESCDFCENFSFCYDHDQSYCGGINYKWKHQAKLDEMKGGAK